VIAAALACLPGCRQQPKSPDVTQLLADLAGADEAKSGKASLALIPIGAPAVPGLAAMLQNPEPKLRARAATTLWGMGEKAADAVEALSKALQDADLEVRRSAAMALGAIGPAAAPAVPALIGALKDRDYAVRQQAAQALGAIGPAAKAALPALDVASKHDGIRPTVEEARRKITGGS
jgi:HEAT repeat protein